MRKPASVIFLFICALSALALNACQQHHEKEKPNEICAFICDIDKNTVTIDMAEYITAQDEEKMKKFNLTEEDLLGGYYIYNPDESTSEYKLTPDTTYNFIDWNRDFTDSDDPGIVSVSTTRIEDFIKYLNTYTDARPGMPFFFELDGDHVISITEKPMA